VPQSDLDDTLVRVFVGRSRAGRARYEVLWVAGRPDGRYELRRTPLLALGVARGDVIRIDEGTITEVVRRGDYLAVQLVSAEPLDAAAIEALASLGHALGGRLDAHDDLVAGLAVPRSVGSATLESRVREYASAFPLRAWWVSSTHELELP